VDRKITDRALLRIMNCRIPEERTTSSKHARVLAFGNLHYLFVTRKKNQATREQTNTCAPPRTHAGTHALSGCYSLSSAAGRKADASTTSPCAPKSDEISAHLGCSINPASSSSPARAVALAVALLPPSSPTSPVLLASACC